MAPLLNAQFLLVLRLALVISLYAFLCVAIFILWQDLKKQSRLLASRQTPQLTLVHKTSEGQQTLRFSIPEILIGRDLACDCTLDDSTISAQHARFSFHHNQWWIEDMGSRNGTYLNHQLVISPLVVTSRDEVRLGQVHLTVIIGEESVI